MILADVHSVKSDIPAFRAQSPANWAPDHHAHSHRAIFDHVQETLRTPVGPLAYMRAHAADAPFSDLPLITLSTGVRAKTARP
jgi:hypothetical protein